MQLIWGGKYEKKGVKIVRIRKFSAQTTKLGSTQLGSKKLGSRAPAILLKMTMHVRGRALDSVRAQRKCSLMHGCTLINFFYPALLLPNSELTSIFCYGLLSNQTSICDCSHYQIFSHFPIKSVNSNQVVKYLTKL